MNERLIKCIKLLIDIRNQMRRLVTHRKAFQLVDEVFDTNEMEWWDDEMNYCITSLSKVSELLTSDAEHLRIVLTDLMNEAKDEETRETLRYLIESNPERKITINYLNKED